MGYYSTTYQAHGGKFPNSRISGRYEQERALSAEPRPCVSLQQTPVAPAEPAPSNRIFLCSSFRLPESADPPQSSPACTRSCFHGVLSHQVVCPVPRLLLRMWEEESAVREPLALPHSPRVNLACLAPLSARALCSVCVAAEGGIYPSDLPPSPQVALVDTMVDHHAKLFTAI